MRVSSRSPPSRSPPVAPQDLCALFTTPCYLPYARLTRTVRTGSCRNLPPMVPLRPRNNQSAHHFASATRSRAGKRVQLILPHRQHLAVERGGAHHPHDFDVLQTPHLRAPDAPPADIIRMLKAPATPAGAFFTPLSPDSDRSHQLRRDGAPPRSVSHATTASMSASAAPANAIIVSFDPAIGP